MKIRQIPGWIVVIAAVPFVFTAACIVTMAICLECERHERANARRRRAQAK